MSIFLFHVLKYENDYTTLQVVQTIPTNATVSKDSDMTF